MKYLFLLYNDENHWDTLPSEQKQETVAAYMAYADAMKNAGALIAGEPLEHTRNGKRIRGETVQDGPFADGKEQLGGFYMIEAKDLDEALDWAARCPCANTGHVEVRPVWDFES